MNITSYIIQKFTDFPIKPNFKAITKIKTIQQCVTTTAVNISLDSKECIFQSAVWLQLR